jgi:hypothetical protein
MVRANTMGEAGIGAFGVKRMMFNQRTHRGQINSFGIVHKECAMRISIPAIGAPSIGSASGSTSRQQNFLPCQLRLAHID